MRNNLTKIIAFITCLSISNCSNEKEVLEVANNFFSLIDQKDYRAAYQLLSKHDKQAMDADSFHVFCYRQEGLSNQEDFELYSTITEDFQKVKTLIQPNQESTFVLAQILRIPDFQLIAKTMEDIEKAEEFFEFYKKMKAQGTIPTKLDSSRTIKVSKENGQFVVSLGLSEYAKYDSILKTIEEENLSKIFITPILIKIYNPNGVTLPYLKYQIENRHSRDVGSVTCALYVDGTLVDNDIYFYEGVKAGKKEVRDDYVTIDDKSKLLVHSSKKIERSRIKIVPRSVYFDSAYNNDKKKLAMEKSGFEGFHFFKLSALTNL